MIFRDYILIANFLGMVFLPFAFLAILNYKLFMTIKVQKNFQLEQTILNRALLLLNLVQSRYLSTAGHICHFIITNVFHIFHIKVRS